MMDKKNIFYLITDLENGGAQVHFISLVKNTNRNFYKVYAIVPPTGFYLSEVEKHADEVIKIDFISNNLSIFKELRYYILKEKPFIIYAHLIKGLLFVGISNIGLKNKFYCNLHTIFNKITTGSKKRALLFNLITFIFQVKCHYVVVSENMKQNFIQSGIKSKNMTVLYHGISQVEFYPQLDNKDIKDDGLKIAYIGRLHPEKGVQKIFSIARTLRYENIQFEIIGNGPLQSKLSQEIILNNLNKVKLLGFIADIKPYMSKNDIILVPSESESFGLVILEAMACALPVIASNVGGIPELIIDGKGGFLCEPHDIDGFVEKIQYLKDNPHLREEFSAFNRKRFEDNFTLEQMINKLEALYES